MERPLSVIVVSGDAERAGRWSSWLRWAGYMTLTCPGPEAVEDCPRLDGGRCSRRQLFDLAVVDVEPSAGSETAGGWPQRVCTKVPDDRRTVFVDELGVDPPFGDDSVWVREPATRSSLVAATRRATRIGRAGPQD